MSQTNTPPPPAVLLQQFMQEVVDNNLDEPTLAQKYMCTSLLQRRDEKGDKVRNMFHMTLVAYRDNLHKRQIDPKSLVIIPYNALAAGSPEIMGDMQQVYTAQYNGKTFCHFLMQDGKIASLNLLNKGKRGFFISYCE